MKQLRSVSILLPLFTLLSLFLSACSSSPGNEGIAFLRDGHLWTIDPNGKNAFEAVVQDTAVLDYGLSPDHRIFVFRTVDSNFARTSAGQHLSFHPLTGQTGDIPAALHTIGIDGGSPIPIILSSPDLARSAAWWNPAGNRVIYREGADPKLSSPDLVTWWVAQDDQPAGIARKLLPNSFSLPSITMSNNPAEPATTIGSFKDGLFLSSLAGTNVAILRPDHFPGQPLSASLERILWQPVQTDPAFLYALPAETNKGDEIKLVLQKPHEAPRTVTSCICRQFAWSPDGKRILYSTPTGYTLFTPASGQSSTFSAEAGAVPYWSASSQFLLLDGLHTLTLIQPAQQRSKVLLSDGQPAVMNAGPLPAVNAFLQPVTNNLWNSDSQRFVLLTRGRTLWQGQQLPTDGPYTVQINAQGTIQGTPFLLDNSSHDIQPGWSYVNPSTSFLL